MKTSCLTHVLSACLGLFLYLSIGTVQAALVSVTSSADMSDGGLFSTALLPIGTTVSADVQFDIGPGTVFTSSLSNVSGTFTWLDSTFGTQTFIADSAFISNKQIDGSAYHVSFLTESAPIITGIEITGFSITFAAPPNTSAEFYDHILNSSVSGMRVLAMYGNSGDWGNLTSNVTGSISAVPIPGALMLFISGLLGIFVTRTVNTKIL